MPQLTIAQLRPSPMYKTRSTLDWPPIENDDSFFLPISERFTSVKHAQDNGFLQDLKRVREKMMSERSEVLPWSCKCKYVWKDLGSGYNPRFVREGACRSKTCWFGHFDCVPQKYEINVLKRIDVLEDPLEFSSQVVDDYVFVPINVTVNCKCMRS